MSAITKVYNNKETRGDIRVQKTFMIPLDRIYEEEGFNIRVHLEEDIEEMADAWWSEEQIPPVIVETQPDGRFKLIDGHRRTHGAHRSNEKYGTHITHLEAKESIAKGEHDQLMFMVKTTRGSVPLKPWETSVVAKRLKDLGASLEEISSAIGRGISNVKHHIAVASLPEEIFELVKQGKIQDSLALEIVRKQGVQAVFDALDQSQGKKVKRADTRLWSSKTGKDAVQVLLSDNVVITEGVKVTNFRIPNEDAEILLEAMKRLKMEKTENENNES